MTGKKITLCIASRAEYVVAIRAALRGLGAEENIAPRTMSQIELCVSEAVNNCIKHAYGNDPDQEIRVEWKSNAQTIELAISDTGRPMDPALMEQARHTALQIDPDDPASLKTNGWGLSFINQLMDNAEYRTAGGDNRLLIKLAKERSHEDRQ